MLTIRPSKTQKLLFGLVGVAFLVTPPAATAKTSAPVIGEVWGQYQHDAGHSGFNPDETILNTSNVSQLTLAWQANAGTSGGTVVVANGIAYAADRRVRAFDEATGNELWVADPNGWVGRTPAIAGGLVYVSTGNGRVLAFDAATGARRWSFRRDFDFVTGPVVESGVVYVGSEDHAIYALDAATGTRMWVHATADRIFNAPAVADGVVYVASEDHLYALDASTGARKWQQLVLADGPPVIVNGILYVVRSDGELIAMDPATGAQIWAWKPPSGVLSFGPVVADGVAYAGGADGGVYAVDAATGDEIWRAGPVGDAYEYLATGNGVVYVTQTGGFRSRGVLALDAATGGLLWQYGSLPQYIGPPVVADGRVYVNGDPSGGHAHLWAYGLPTW